MAHVDDINEEDGLDALVAAVDAVGVVPDTPYRGGRRVAAARARTISYIITINPNVPANDDRAPAIRAALVSGARRIVGEIFYTFRTGNQSDVIQNKPHAAYPTYDHPSHFRGMEVHSAIEVGEQMNLIHMHLVLQIKHTSNIRLNLDTIRAFFQSTLRPIINYVPYINVKSFRSLANVIDYIRKQRHD